MDDSNGNWKFSDGKVDKEKSGKKRGRDDIQLVNYKSGAGKGVEFSPRGSSFSGAAPWDRARTLVGELLQLHDKNHGSPVSKSSSIVYPVPVHSPLLRLHEEILEFEAFMSPTPSEVAIAGRALAAVHHVLMDLFPQARLEVFGSRSLGLVLPTSDWDLVCMGVTGTRANMHRIASEMSARGVAKKTEVIDSARVPIVKIWEASSNICLDISFDGASASAQASRAVMSDLLRRFPPARPLALVLKYFLLQRGLNDTYTGGVGSYLLVIMTVSVVQAALRRASSIGQEPKMPPITSKVASQVAAGRCGGGEINLGALLVSALEFFGRNLAAGEVGVSVKGELGGYYKKSQRGWVDGERPLLLSFESPADPTQDVGRNSWGIGKAKRAFSAAHCSLSRAIRTWGARAQSTKWVDGEGFWCTMETNKLSSSAASRSGVEIRSAPVFGPVFSPPSQSLLASVLRVDDLLRGRLEELQDQKAEARKEVASCDAPLSVAQKAAGLETSRGGECTGRLDDTVLSTINSSPDVPTGEVIKSLDAGPATQLFPCVDSSEPGESTTGNLADKARQAALAKLEGIEKSSGGTVFLRHKRLLSDILTRRERGVGAVIPAPAGGGWY